VPVFKLLCKEVPDYGSCEPKHVAVCDVTLKWCAGRHIVVCLWCRKTQRNLSEEEKKQ